MWVHVGYSYGTVVEWTSAGGAAKYSQDPKPKPIKQIISSKEYDTGILPFCTIDPRYRNQCRGSMRCKDYCQVPAIFARIEITDLLIPPPLLTEPDGTVRERYTIFCTSRYAISSPDTSTDIPAAVFAKSRYANSSPDTPIQVPIRALTVPRRGMIPRQGLKTTDFSRKYREDEESKSDLVRNRSVYFLVSNTLFVIRYSLFNIICPQYMFLGLHPGEDPGGE